MLESLSKAVEKTARSYKNQIRNPLKKSKDLAPTPASHIAVILTRSRRIVNSTWHLDFNYDFSLCSFQLY